MNAGAGVGKASAAATPVLEEPLGCSESEAWPPESFFEDEDSGEQTGDVEAVLGAEPRLLAALAGAFRSWCESGSLFAGTTKLFSAVGRFCVFGADEDRGSLFELA